MKTIILILILLTSIIFGQNSDYNALSFGYGNSYGGYGIICETRNDFMGYHMGVGYFPADDLPSNDVFLFSLGYKLFIKNDIYLNVIFGGLGVEASNGQFYGLWMPENISNIKQHTVYGLSALVGQTFWQSKNGKVGINLNIGGSYIVTKVKWIDLGIILAADVGFSVKL